ESRQLSKNTTRSLNFHPGHNPRLSPLVHNNHETFKSPYELEFKLEQTLPGYRNSKDRLGSLNYDNIIDNFRSRLVCKDLPPTGRSPDQHGTHSNACHVIQTQSLHPKSHPVDNSNGSSDTKSSGQSDLAHSDSVSNSQRDSRSPTPLPDIHVTNKTVQSSQNGHDSGISSPRRKFQGHEDTNSDGDLERTNINGSVGDDKDNGEGSNLLNADYQHMGDDNDRQQHKRKRKLVRKTSKGVYLAPSQTANQTESNTPGADSEKTQVNQPLQSTSSRHASLDSGSVAEQEETVEAKLARLQIQYQRRVIDREGRKTIAEELDYKARRDFKFTETDLDPTIIEVQVLERGQYFGLAPILFQDQSSLSVVSNGAECLVISKKLFLQWATEKCLRYLRQTESPYPSEQELHRKLQEVVNWQANRSLVYHRLAHQIAERKARRKQFLPTYQGQYCFRSGPA
ncbi:hypothetical protein EGW08_019535, partial [Elysia chlorotica]